ncbi:MAG: hypothetical protein IJL32_10090 [Oscillospiraceae bacterium]|nr:hypothetical protein [Oscillospiraceae bacterium]
MKLNPNDQSFHYSQRQWIFPDEARAIISELQFREIPSNGSRVRFTASPVLLSGAAMLGITVLSFVLFSDHLEKMTGIIFLAMGILLILTALCCALKKDADGVRKGFGKREVFMLLFGICMIPSAFIAFSGYYGKSILLFFALVMITGGIAVIVRFVLHNAGISLLGSNATPAECIGYLRYFSKIQRALLAAPVYRYEYDGMQYEACAQDFSVNTPLTAVGDTVRLHVSREDPYQISTVSGHREQKKNFVSSLIVGLFLAALGLLILINLPRL